MPFLSNRDRPAIPGLDRCGDPWSDEYSVGLRLTEGNIGAKKVSLFREGKKTLGQRKPLSGELY